MPGTCAQSPQQHPPPHLPPLQGSPDGAPGHGQFEQGEFAEDEEGDDGMDDDGEEGEEREEGEDDEHSEMRDSQLPAVLGTTHAHPPARKAPTHPPSYSTLHTAPATLKATQHAAYMHPTPLP